MHEWSFLNPELPEASGEAKQAEADGALQRLLVL